MRLEGKVAFITGGARGLGASHAKLFAKEGASVTIGDLREEEGRSLEAEINETGGEAMFVPMDVTSEPDWERVIGATVERFGKLDVLVNNAIISARKSWYGKSPYDVWDGSREEAVADWDRMMDVGAKGVFLGTMFAIPEMRKAGGGSIVNISSVSGMIGQLSSHPAYNSSKGAVRILTKWTAVQCAKEGIRANSVHPGPTITPNTERLRSDPDREAEVSSLIAMGRWAETEEISYGVLFLASDESSYMTGSELVIDGGMTAQ